MSETLVAAGPPVGWLAAALSIVAVALVLAAVSDAPTLIGAAWLLSGPVAISVLAVFTLRDTRRRANVVYASRAWVARSYQLCLVVATLGIVLSATRIAFWAGRL